MRASALTRPTRTDLARWTIWLGLLAITTFVLRSVRGEIDQAHVVLTYLLIVLGGSAGGGRVLGVALALLGVGLIDYYFQPPFDTLAVNKGPDWVVLLAFLGTAIVATQ